MADVSKAEALLRYPGLEVDIFDQLEKCGFFRQISPGRYETRNLPAPGNDFMVCVSKFRRERKQAAQQKQQSEQEKFDAAVAQAAAQLNRAEGKRIKRAALQAIAEDLGE